jgi:hypothetical protein
LEAKENKPVTDVIRKLDKNTLNLYNALRTALGAGYRRWTRFTLTGRKRVEGFEDFREVGLL